MWSDLYGPQEYHGDNYTNLFSRKYYNPDVTLANDDLIVSGYGNLSSLPSHPFKSENMILFSDGACDSACTIFSHFLTWEGKVKQIAVGGRPQEGLMQAIGGTRGSQVEEFADIMSYTTGLQELSPLAFATQANQTELGTIARLGSYVIQRTVNPSQPNQASVNLFNSIAQDDFSLTPLQFAYEAADCRIFWTAEMVLNVSMIWTKVADVWNGNFTDCVAGSTGQPSSLSGNATLKNGGVAANVSASEEPGSSPSANATANQPLQVSAASRNYGHGIPLSVARLLTRNWL